MAGAPPILAGLILPPLLPGREPVQRIERRQRVYVQAIQLEQQRVGLWGGGGGPEGAQLRRDRKGTRLNSSHSQIPDAVFCLKKKTDAIHLHALTTHTEPRLSSSPAADLRPAYRHYQTPGNHDLPESTPPLQDSTIPRATLLP